MHNLRIIELHMANSIAIIGRHMEEDTMILNKSH